MAIKNRVSESGVDLPLPTQIVRFHDQTEETDGDRTRQREGWPEAPGEAPKPRNIPGVPGTLAGSRADLDGRGAKLRSPRSGLRGAGQRREFAKLG
jgi:small conductance mechanosensitive channel